MMSFRSAALTSNVNPNRLETITIFHVPFHAFFVCAYIKEFFVRRAIYPLKISVAIHISAEESESKVSQIVSKFLCFTPWIEEIELQWTTYSSLKNSILFAASSSQDMQKSKYGARVKTISNGFALPSVTAPMMQSG